jgi:hypothetical protein
LVPTLSKFAGFVAVVSPRRRSRSALRNEAGAGLRVRLMLA